MPRSTKDSDEELELRIGRKIRGLGAAATDSPLRRSSRIKQPIKHYDTSPDSAMSDASNTGSTQTTRSSRRRTMNIDSESLRNMRTRKNSVSSDVSEATEGEAPPHTPSKRITRRSLAALPARDTPKTNTRSMNRRLVRAGSETKSSPPPVVRTTHKTRASSMGPTGEEDRKQVDSLDTYFKGRRRASIRRSESAVTEEPEESKNSSRLQLEKTLPEVDENESDVTDSSLKSSPNKLSTSFKDSSERGDGKVQSVTPETSSAIAERKSADSTNIPTALQNPEETSKESGLKTENLLNTGKEEGKSPRSKENQRFNLMNEITSERKGEPVVSIVKLVTTKHFTSPLIHKSVNEKENISPRSEINVKRRLSKDLPETVVKESVDISKESIDINNVIESNDTDDTNSSIIIAKAIEDSPDEKLDDDFSRIAKPNESLKENSLEVSSEYSLKFSDKSLVSEDSTQNTSKTDNNAMDVVTIDEDEDCNKTIPESKETLNKSTEPADQTSDQTLDQTSKEESVKQDASENNSDATQTMNVSNETENTNDISMMSVEMDSQSDLTESNTAINESSKANDSMTVDTPKEIQKSLLAETSLTSEPTESELPKTDDDKSSTELSEEADKTASPNKNEETDSSLVETAKNESEAEIKISSPEKESKLESSQTAPPKSNEKDDDNIDSDSNIGNLFHDIPADEWKRKENPSKGAEVENNSLQHSMSTERLGNESEAECDLVLVDKEAWLAAENMRAAKEKEPFDYDSDDTVVLKSRIDSLRCKDDTVPKMSTICEMDVDSDEEECGTNRRKSLHMRKSLPKDENTEKAEEPEGTDDVKEVNSPDKDTTTKLNTSRRKSVTEKTPQGKKQSVTELKPTKLNLSQRDSAEENKSLNESMENVSLEDQDKSLREDANKSVEEDEVESKHPQEGSAKKRVSLNKSKIEDDSSNLLRTSKSGSRDITMSSDKTVKKLNVSLNKTPESKQLNVSKKSVLSTSLLNKDDFSTEESDASKHEISKLSQKSSAKKRKINRNYSTVVHVDSDSESNDIESDRDDSKNQNKLSRILFASNSSDDDADSNKSMDSDIKKEYNLDGKNISKFSDDDIPGDECRASESESSDPNDNGSDLADFVVGDDEVEDEEESDNDSDAIDVENNDEENEEEKDLVDFESEEKGSPLIWSDEDKKEEEEEEEEDEEKIDNMNVEEEDEEMSLSETEEEKEKEEIVEQKSQKVEMIESPKSCKKKKSNKENSRESILSRTPASETKKNRSKIKEVAEEHEEEKKALPSIPLGSLKKQKKSKAQHAIEITDTDTEEQTDKFSETLITRKGKKPNVSMEVSKKKKKKNKSQQKNTIADASPQSKVFAKQQGVDNSYEAPERVSFTKALEEALEAIKRATDHVNTNKEIKKKNQKQNVEKVQQQKGAREQKLQKKQNDKAGKTEIIKTQSKNLKRLSDEVIESISETPTRPKKRQKIQKKEEQIMPSRSMFGTVSIENVDVNNSFIPLSSCGGTTQFKAVNLKKIKKQPKQVPAVAAFRQRILSRNSREPISAYLMYLQKQKATGKDKFSYKPF